MVEKGLLAESDLQEWKGNSPVRKALEGQAWFKVYPIVTHFPLKMLSYFAAQFWGISDPTVCGGNEKVR